MYETGALELIPIASIRPSPYQYRTNFDDERQRQLMESLQANGLSTPVLVRPVPITAESARQSPSSTFELVSGERRLRAAKALGWEKIRALCEQMTDAEAAARVVTENEVRADTNLLEKAAGYKRLTQPPCGLTLQQIAERFGYRSHSAVQRIIDVLDQPEAIRRFVSHDTIGEGHIRFLSRIKDLKTRVKLAKRAAEEGWTVKMTEDRVVKVLGKSNGARGKAAKNTGASFEYEYKGFHCSLVGEEVVLAGRNFKRQEERLEQFLADYRTAVECFLRDFDDRPSGASYGPDVGAAANEIDPDTIIPAASSYSARTSTEMTADLLKQAAEVEAAKQSLKDLFSEIAKKAGTTESAGADDSQNGSKLPNS